MIFEDGYKITQKFGVNKDYYKQFGLPGHEGLDLVPKTANRHIYAPESGVVIKDFDDARKGGNYGNFITIWNKENKRAWFFAHNEKNYVELNDEVKQGQLIAHMGDTGNTTGLHAHVGLVKTDSNGIRVGTSNGFKGFIDPAPVLIDLENPEEKISSELDEMRASRDKWKAESKDLEQNVKSLKEEVRDLDKSIKIANTNLEKKIDELITMKEDRDKWQRMYDAQNQNLGSEVKAANKKLETENKQIAELNQQIENLKKTILEYDESAQSDMLYISGLENKLIKMESEVKKKMTKAPETNIKEFYKSKTIWAIVIGFVAKLLQDKFGYVVDANLQFTILLAVYAALRAVTKEAIVWELPVVKK